MIRLAKTNDLKDLVTLAKQVYGEFLSKHHINFVEEDMNKLGIDLINADHVLILERDNKVVGMTAWSITGHPTNKDCKIFQEILWCCNSEHKTDALLLLRALEQKAKESNANVIIMGHFTKERMSAFDRIYKRMGYEFLEIQYSKSGRI